LLIDFAGRIRTGDTYVENAASELEIRKALDKYKFYHNIKLTETITTVGSQSFVRAQKLCMRHLQSLDLKGKRVLDIGCRDGLFSFAAEAMGAAEVIGIDNDLSVPATEFLIPFFKSKIRMDQKNLYDVTPSSYGKFDVVIFPGVLYHLRYPFWGLKAIRDIMNPNGYLLTETAIFESQPHQALLFCPVGAESPYEATSPTIFNEKGLRDSLTSLGFETTSVAYARSGRALSGFRRRAGIRLRTVFSLGKLPPIKPTRAVFVSRFTGFDADSFVNKYFEGTHDFHTRHGGGMR
jgi:2-polyprenyl-3-methyl-5-hydroxy-6-metoxy-1,4-benzoquinol methylase